MSYTTVLNIDVGKGHTENTELRNSWQSAPRIWIALCTKYFNNEHWMSLSSELWDLYKNKSVPEHHRAVLMMTFDKAYIAKENYHKAIKDINQFMADFNTNVWSSSHWPKIVKILSETKSPAIGFHMTSVSENPFDGDWNDELEEYDPIDWSTAFEVYEELALTGDKNAKSCDE